MPVSPESHFAYKTLSDPLKLTKVFLVQKTLWHCQNKCSDILKIPSKIYTRPIYRISVKTGWPLKNIVVSTRFFLTFKISSFHSSFSILWIPRYMSSFAFWNSSLEGNQNHEEDVNEEKKCYLSFFQLFLSPSFYSE